MKKRINISAISASLRKKRKEIKPRPKPKPKPKRINISAISVSLRKKRKEIKPRPKPKLRPKPKPKPKPKKKIKKRINISTISVSLRKKRKEIKPKPKPKPKKKKKIMKQRKFHFFNSYYSASNDLQPIHLIDYNRDKPLFSFIGPAIRDYRYIDFYKSIFHRDIPFEVVFVGNKPPLVEMPGNFRYIETDLHIGRCMERAAREANGEYLITSSDDLIYSNGFLIHILRYCTERDMDKYIIFFGRTKKYHYAHASNQFVVKKSDWHKIGGLEKKSYELGKADWTGLIDIEFRLQQSGHEVFFANFCQSSEVERDYVYMGYTGVIAATRRIMEGDTKRVDNGLNYGFWNSDNTTRMLPFSSYSNEDLEMKDKNDI